MRHTAPVAQLDRASAFEAEEQLEKFCARPAIKAALAQARELGRGIARGEYSYSLGWAAASRIVAGACDA